MEIVAINTIIGVLKSVATIIKSKGILYFAGIICFLGLFIIVVMITFLFYASKSVLIKTIKQMDG